MCALLNETGIRQMLTVVCTLESDRTHSQALILLCAAVWEWCTADAICGEHSWMRPHTQADTNSCEHTWIRPHTQADVISGAHSWLRPNTQADANMPFTAEWDRTKRQMLTWCLQLNETEHRADANMPCTAEWDRTKRQMLTWCLQLNETEHTGRC